MNIMVFYSSPLPPHTKPKRLTLSKHSQVHVISQNNIIIGNFNFADNEVGECMGIRDRIRNSKWAEFKSVDTCRKTDLFFLRHGREKSGFM